MDLKKTAEEYESVETKNICDLKKVDVKSQLQERTFTDKNGKDFTIKVIVVDDEEYRVPISVIKQLKIHLEKNKDLKFFSVGKSGEGLKTEYVLIPQ